MISLVIALLCAGLMLAGISLHKTYHSLPKRELKRRARSGQDEIAQLLYRVVANGASLDAVLWVVIGLGGAGFFVALVPRVSPPLVLLAGGLLIWGGFAWLPRSRVSEWGLRLARTATPILIRVLDIIGPRLQAVLGKLQAHSPIHFHTGLYQKEDLIDIIEKQQVQADNRIAHEELQIALHALTFGDKIIRDVMVPRKVVHMVPAAEPVGPIIMDELHKSGHSRFPVYGESQDEVVGTLFIKDLVNVKAGGQVRDRMSRDVYYVHDEQTLYEALQAFLKTKHHLFVVVNRFEEFVGILTIEDIIEQIVGHPIVDEFDKYDDMRAVAALHAHKQHEERAHQEPVKQAVATDSTQEGQTVVESE